MRLKTDAAAAAKAKKAAAKEKAEEEEAKRLEADAAAAAEAKKAAAKEKTEKEEAMRLVAEAAAPESAAGDGDAVYSSDRLARSAAPMELPMLGAAESLWCSPAPMPAWLRDRLGGGLARPAGAAPTDAFRALLAET